MQCCASPPFTQPTLQEPGQDARTLPPQYQAPYIPPAPAISLERAAALPHWQPRTRRAVVVASGTYRSTGQRLQTLTTDVYALVQALQRHAGCVRSV